MLRFDAADGVATLTLDRPASLNAFTPELGRELLDALARVADDPALRAVLVTGAGRAFSSGADLKAERRRLADGTPDLGSNLRAVYNPLILAVRALPKPVVAAVNGPAAGIGCSLALACDLIVAAESAYFLLAFVRVGLIPDGGASTLLTAKLGAARALQLALLGERLPAARAHEWGLVSAVHPDDELRDAAGALACRLADGPTVAYGNIKRAIHAAQGDLAAQLELEATLQQEQGATADFAEGVAAFRAKRPPRFSGR